MAQTLETAPPKSEAKARRTPEAVLADWVARIAEQSGGVLQAEVMSRSCLTDLDITAYHLDVAVPELGGRGHGIVGVYTPLDTPYPAVVGAQVFQDLGLYGYAEVLDPNAPKEANRADDGDELDAIIARVVESPPVAEVLQRLVARVQEQRRAAP